MCIDPINKGVKMAIPSSILNWHKVVGICRNFNTNVFILINSNNNQLNLYEVWPEIIKVNKIKLIKFPYNQIVFLVYHCVLDKFDHKSLF